MGEGEVSREGGVIHSKIFGAEFLQCDILIIIEGSVVKSVLNCAQGVLLGVVARVGHSMPASDDCQSLPSTGTEKLGNWQWLKSKNAILTFIYHMLTT